jgi:signal transduction histidine kinase
MSDWYFASLLLTAGACLALALHSLDLTLQARGRSFIYLLALSLFEGAYCLVVYPYFRETSPARALPWAQAFCAFTPYMTCVFGGLTLTLTDRPPKWLVVGQKVNIVLTVLFTAGVITDMIFKTELTMRYVITDLATAHRHRVVFAPLGMAYLNWVTLAFLCFAAVLFRDAKTRREFLPIAIGCAIYFVATINDFAICVALRDGYFIQHFGFLSLILGCWRVLGRRLELSIVEQEHAVVRLEKQRHRLLLAAPLMHKQKLDSLGTLAAGVAHEINNPIHGILNYVQLLKRGLSPDQQRDFAEEIEREAKRVAEIVRHLLYFGRPDDTQALAANVNEIVKDTLVLLRGPLRDDNIVLDVKVEDGVRDIVCRIQQLQQVLMNLITNARDALNRRNPERVDQKTITIRVCTLSSDPDWVRFEVIDNGDGFDAETAQRVFDPFFTTKASEGTGLGLSISHGIARAHGGKISCDSDPGRQTIFRVDLPCAPVSAPVGLRDSAPHLIAERSEKERRELEHNARSGAFGRANDERDAG